ncbi:MAG: cytochrome P450, partial [Myxococcales bacterium]|nr:cytochrome P450 [Myxococcales bacterium]
RGIMLLDFEEHRHHRRIMQNAFKKPVLVEYLSEMNEPIARGIRRWQPAKKFHVFTAIKQLTLDLATIVFMGEQLGPEADQINQAFIDTVRAGTALVRYPVPGGRWKKGLDGRKLLVDFFRSRIDSKRDSTSNDLFSQLCRAETEDGHRFSDDDVINHMVFLMMAAHDTSTSALTSMTYLLAVNPGWQERLRAAARAAGDDLEVALDDPVTEPLTWTMKEALRLYPPVASMPRYCLREHEWRGYRIPAETIIGLYPIHTHHLPEVWTDPERFDPERFAEPRREDREHPGAWVPFGGGVHTCIGQHFAGIQIRAVMLRLLRRFRWRVVPGYAMPFAAVPIAKPEDGLPVTLERLD